MSAELVAALRAKGIAMGTVYSGGLHVGYTTDEAKKLDAVRLGAHVTYAGASFPAWEIRCVGGDA